jgi:hypothetical protein
MTARSFPGIGPIQQKPDATSRTEWPQFNIPASLQSCLDLSTHDARTTRSLQPRHRGPRVLRAGAVVLLRRRRRGHRAQRPVKERPHFLGEALRHVALVDQRPLDALQLRGPGAVRG